jgi:hypothetical protein
VRWAIVLLCLAGPLRAATPLGVAVSFPLGNAGTPLPAGSGFTLYVEAPTGDVFRSTFSSTASGTGPGPAQQRLGPFPVCVAYQLDTNVPAARLPGNAFFAPLSLYGCPMQDGFSSAPGSCPKCGMPLQAGLIRHFTGAIVLKGPGVLVNLRISR